MLNRIGRAKMKKKSKRLLVFGVTVFLAAVSIMAVLIAQSSSPERRLRKQLESAERYLAELDYEQAIVAYRSAIEIDPKNEAAYVGLVDTYIAWADKVFLDNPEQAMDILEKAIEELERLRNEENAGLIDAQIDRIRRHMEELKSDWTQELTGTEEIEDPYVRLDAGEYEDVLEKYLAILENDPTDPEIYLVIVEAYIRMGDYDKALEYAKLGYEKTGDERLKEKIDMIEGGNISDSSGRLIKMTWEEDGTDSFFHE